MASINKRIELRGAVGSWQRFTVKDWKTNLQKMRIGKTGQLAHSFQTKMLINESGFSRADFSFLFKGRFVDMGVRKGISIGDVNKSKARRKRWYSKTLAHSVNRLPEILAVATANNATVEVVNAIEKK